MAVNSTLTHHHISTSTSYPLRKNPAEPPRYISPTLQELMDDWPDDELIFRFRFDGAYDFAQKLYAGEVLYRRNHNLEFLQQEKRKIVGAMQQDMREFEDIKTFTNGVVRKERKEIFANIAMVLMYLMLIILFGLHDQSIKEFLLYNLLIAMIGVFIILVFHRRRIMKSLKQAADDYKNYRHRLELIQERWMF